MKKLYCENFKSTQQKYLPDLHFTLYKSSRSHLFCKKSVLEILLQVLLESNNTRVYICLQNAAGHRSNSSSIN